MWGWRKTCAVQLGSVLHHTHKEDKWDHYTIKRFQKKNFTRRQRASVWRWRADVSGHNGLGMSSEWTRGEYLQVAMRWTPPGQRKQGQPKATWRSKCDGQAERDMSWHGGGAWHVAAGRARMEADRRCLMSLKGLIGLTNSRHYYTAKRERNKIK